MKSLIRNFAIAALLVTVVSGCSTYSNLYSNYDTSIDFSQYETFAWAPDSGVVESRESDTYDNDIVRNNAKNYITHVLSQRGFLVNTDSPDVVMELVLLNEKKERVVTYHSHPAPYYYYNPYYFPYYYPHPRYYTWYGWHGWIYDPYWDHRTTTYTKTYITGTVTLNMYDRKLKKLVWTASAEGDIYDPVYIQHDVHPAIDRILKKFPIKPIDKQKELKLKNGIVRINGVDREIYNRASR